MTFSELESTGIGLDQKPLALKKINNLYRNLSPIQELGFLLLNSLTSNKWNDFKLNQITPYDIIPHTLALKTQSPSDSVEIQVTNEIGGIVLELTLETEEMPKSFPKVIILNNWTVSIKPATQSLDLVVICEFCVAHSFQIPKIGERT